VFFAEGEPARDIGSMPARRLVYEYRTALVHFLLGTLLNLYTLFFFKSASLFVSFAFMLVAGGPAGGQESKRVKAQFGLSLSSPCSAFACCRSAQHRSVFVGSIGRSFHAVDAGRLPAAAVIIAAFISMPPTVCSRHAGRSSCLSVWC